MHHRALSQRSKVYNIDAQCQSTSKLWAATRYRDSQESPPKNHFITPPGKGPTGSEPRPTQRLPLRGVSGELG